MKCTGNIEKYHFYRGIKASISAMSEEGAEYINGIIFLMEE